METFSQNDPDNGHIHRSGVVAIIGPPNAGKSTLLNHFLGQKIAIVTPKPQTTRNRILGVLTGASYQIILLDTPGLHKPRERLNREMVRIALDTLTEADVVLFLADATDRASERLEKLGKEFSEYLKAVRAPVVLALNKVDRLDKSSLLPLMEWFRDFNPFTAVVPISALLGDGTDLLVDELVRLRSPKWLDSLLRVQCPITGVDRDAMCGNQKPAWKCD